MSRYLPLIAFTLFALTTIAVRWYEGEASLLGTVGWPVTTALLLLVAFSTRDALRGLFRRLVVAGLVASIVGDVLLAFRPDNIVPAVTAFVVAHSAYLIAFSSRAPFLRNRVTVIGYAAAATALLALVLPAVGGSVRIVVVAAVLSMSLMAAQGASWMLDEPRSSAARIAAIGAALLVSSFALFTFDRFANALPARDLLVLGTYWAAQACIALSVQRPAAPAIRM